MNALKNLDKVGNTPTVELTVEELHNVLITAKLEYFNPSGSVKDRAASYILGQLLGQNRIDINTTVIESSSGNFGVALAAYCKKYGLNFICVVDPHITTPNEMLIRAYGARVIKVTQPDENGGYLLSRIRKVKELIATIRNSYWINQYGNPLNADAYYYSLGNEICNEVNSVDYVFMGVSSGGTITGVSNRVKERYPAAKVIAVDVVGSVIFGNAAAKRHIPGIGSSIVPSILELARIDEVIQVSEDTTVRMCRELLSTHCLFAGGSSGSVLGAIKFYFNRSPAERPVNVVAIFPDGGGRYTDSIYNDEWCGKVINVHNATSSYEQVASR